jgi:hypothetical protein
MSEQLQTQANVTPAPAQSLTAARSGLSQRKCACDGSSGITGKCEECGKARLTLQRFSTDRAVSSTLWPLLSDSFQPTPRPGPGSGDGVRPDHSFGRVKVLAHAPQTIQTKLKADQSGDQYEQEADRVAEQVTGVSAPSGSQADQRSTALSQAPLLIQRLAADETAAAPESTPAPGPARSGTAAETAPAGLIVEDEAGEIGPGQMRKSEFLDELRTAVCAAANAELAAAGRSSEGCPYIERAFARYRAMSGSQLERGLRRYAPEAAGATTARDYIPAVSERVRRAVAVWATTGQITGVPEELADQIPGGGLLGAIGSVFSGVVRGIGSMVSGIGSLFFKARDAGAREPADPQSIQSQLGPGRSLDSSVMGRMEGAFGHSFSQVRVHSDGKAAELSSSLNARAFTIGRDIAFGAGEYRPGTLVGDALIAHELAHVVQQRGARPSASPAPLAVSQPRSEIERDADQAAAGAMVALWSDDPREKKKRSVEPQQRSGLQLQRCSPAQTAQPEVPTPPKLPTGPVSEPGPERPMTPSQDPNIDTVTPIIIHDCGNALWPVKYTLPNPAATSGWIIQHVVLDRRELKADGKDRVDPMHDEYWEAFFPRIEQGGRQSGSAASDDQFISYSTERGTSGKTTWVGKLKFYEGTLPNNFERYNRPPAGSLPMTRSRPKWWDDTGTDHNLTAKWDCTPGKSTFGMRMQRGSQVETLGDPVD